MPRWQQAIQSAGSRVDNLKRSLDGFRRALDRGEIGISDFHRRIAGKIDSEQEVLDRMFVENGPPLHGSFNHERLWYRGEQQRLRTRITQMGKGL